jgi:hypothetical protein
LFCGNGSILQRVRFTTKMDNIFDLLDNPDGMDGIFYSVSGWHVFRFGELIWKS